MDFKTLHPSPFGILQTMVELDDILVETVPVPVPAAICFIYIHFLIRQCICDIRAENKSHGLVCFVCSVL